MPRVDTQSPPQSVFIKQRKLATCCRYFSLIAIAITFSTAFFVIKNPTESLETLQKYTANSIPHTYSSPEFIDPDDREVFEGFKTSFLPAEEIILAKRNSKAKREVYEGNITSDFLIWGDLEKQRGHPARIKRRSHYSFMSQDYDDPGPKYVNSREKDDDDLTEEDENERDVNDDDESENSNEDNDKEERMTQQQKDEDPEDDEDEQKRMRPADEYTDDEEAETKSVLPPELHMDKGPFDDVVEQIRGQPELEEGEMGSAANVYKPARSYTVIHAFWKGQGDRDTIRSTQAEIMRQYMDPDANPCQDFYQYACGNWPALNPIPADKAGYDTFEMLRENLDTVLKDLLEFKEYENVPCEFPGPHLDMDEDFLRHHVAAIKSRGENLDLRDTLEKLELEMHNETAADKIKYDMNTENRNKSDVTSRSRRYLNVRSRKTTQLFTTIKRKKYKHINLDFRPQHRKFGKKRSYKSQKTEAQKKKGFYKRKPSHSGRKLLVYKRKVGKRKQPGILRKIFRDTSSFFEKKENFTIRTHDAALKARYLFKSCMNYKILETRGHQPLLDLLDLLGGWPILNPHWNDTDFHWLETMARLRLYNNDILISEWVGPDIKNSDEFVIQFDQTSLGLPTRDYFLQYSNKIYLDAYKKYLLTIALLLGGDPDHVHKSADRLIEFEISLAKITSAPEDRRNVSELYRRMTLRKLEALVPEVKWRRYLCVVMDRTVHSNETVVLFALTYVRNLVQLIKETDSEVLANYLLWRFVRHRVNNLDDRFQSAKQQFYYILFGREQAPPRWKNCISQVNSNMGMALGSMFVQKYFDEMSKNDTLTMTREIQKSFRELLHMTDWIDIDTKKLAAHKVDAMMLRIGYPDFILNKAELDERYKEVIIHPDKYFENILNILQHLTKMEQSRIGQPVNKTLWNTAPAVVNAYYSRNKNQIMFPAGILQPPFYHRHFPRSLNYGGIGVVIGHEITHGFDDKGRLFDCNGNLHRWWSDSAIEAFHHRAQCLIDQYSQYVVPEVNISLDGVNTQGENIADNGGVKQAFRAYLRWLKKNGVEGETLPGLNHTHTQLFFLNFAQVWCGAMRPEAMRNKLKTAVHSPGRFRVIGTLSNSHDFAREFECPPGTPMNPKRKCSVW